MSNELKQISDKLEFILIQARKENEHHIYQKEHLETIEKHLEKLNNQTSKNTQWIDRNYNFKKKCNEHSELIKVVQLSFKDLYSSIGNRMLESDKQYREKIDKMEQTIHSLDKRGILWTTKNKINWAILIFFGQTITTTAVVLIIQKISEMI